MQRRPDGNRENSVVAEAERVERPVAVSRRFRHTSIHRRRKRPIDIVDEQRAVGLRGVLEIDGARPAGTRCEGVLCVAPVRTCVDRGERRTVNRLLCDDGDAPARSLAISVARSWAVGGDRSGAGNGGGLEVDRSGRAAAVVVVAVLPGVRIRAHDAVHDDGPRRRDIDRAAADAVVVVAGGTIGKPDVDRLLRVAVAARRIRRKAAAVRSVHARGIVRGEIPLAFGVEQ